MVPSPLELVLLVGAAFRLTRLAGWDEFPPVERARSWVLGERWVTDVVDGEDVAPSLPGKPPSSEVGGVRPAYERQTLAHLVHCPFCMGWWVSLTVYLAWLAAPAVTLAACVPLAVSSAVGLIAKNLDA